MCVGTWLGWPGPGITPEDKIPESEAREVGGQPAELSSDQVVAVHLSPDDYELYYNGCCNATLWPLFHSMPDRAVFDETFWLAYKSVNEKFAQETLERLRQLDPVRSRRFLVLLPKGSVSRNNSGFFFRLYEYKKPAIGTAAGFQQICMLLRLQYNKTYLFLVIMLAHGITPKFSLLP